MSGENASVGASALPQPPHVDEIEISPFDDALIALTGELRDKLARLAGTPTEGAEEIIGLFPYGHRVVLENYKLITTSLSRSARENENDNESPRLQVQLTDLGRQVIDSCSRSKQEIGALVDRARELHNRFSDNLEPDTEATALSEEAN